MHPANLAFRFLLELGALCVIGLWGHARAEGWLGWVWALALPLLAAAAWGIFAVPGDPSRGGQGVVRVPGALRLAIELAVLGFPAWALMQQGRPQLGMAFGLAVLVHYALSHRRIAWLLGR